MKVYLDITFHSRGIERVITQLVKYLPAAMELTHNPEEADLTIVHVIGRRDHVLKRVRGLKNYAVIQYVLGSCRNPDPNDWLEIWNNAKVVWSYYELSAHIPNLYHAPLAAEADVFHKMDAEKLYLVGTNGNSYKAECIGEVRYSVWKAEGRAAHVGEKFDANPVVDYFQNIDDNELAVLYNKCNWFSCLRRKDGFELPAVEALLCGARPIVFDTPNYRQWFDGLAQFIPEASPDVVIKWLGKLFKDGPVPVSDEEIEETKNRFNWKRSIEEFWERCE